MQLLDWTLPTPAENLACDEALLDQCEQDPRLGVLRFWEPLQHFVVAGFSNRICDCIHPPARLQRKIPILRRISGGQAVLQGPGCLNFSLVLPLQRNPALASICGTNRYVLDRHRQALQPFLGTAICRQGETDLALGGLKFSGNAQRRKKTALLFHGTFLLRLDLTLMEELLPLPPRQPNYRRNRSHRSFLTQLSASASQIKEALGRAWEAQTPRPEESLCDDPVLRNRIRTLVRSRYETTAWNEKF